MSPGLPLHRLAAAGEEFPLPGDQRVELVAVEGELGRGTDEALVQPDDPDDRAVGLGLGPGRKVRGLRGADLIVIGGQ
jgi:hypothetical protein